MKGFIISLLVILNSMTFFSVEATKDQQLMEVASLYQSENLGWPGLKWHEAPLVLTFEDGEVYALGIQQPSEVWEEKKLGNAKLLFAKDDRFGALKLKMHPYFEIDGEKAFLFHMSSPRSVKVLAHEWFHRFQIENFGEDETGPSNGYRQHLNGENVALMALEEELLREFIQTGRLESVREYVAIHRERVKYLDDESIAWEEMQLRMEGLADYVAAKMLGLEKEILAKSNEETLVENAMKWRHYGVGAALGVALDALGVEGWKEKVQKGASLNRLLSERFSGKDEELVTSVKKRLNFKRKRKKVLKQVGDYVAKLDSLQNAFDEGEGVKIRVGSLWGVGVSGGGRSEAIYYLEDGSQVSVNDKSISTSMDGRWSFATKEQSTLYQRQGGYREVKAVTNFTIKLDGLTFQHEGEEPKEYLFTDLMIDSKEVGFKAQEAPGVLVVNGSRVRIEFLD